MDELKVQPGVPYDGQGHTLEITKEIHYPQLSEEIRKVLPDGVHFVGARKKKEEITEDNPMTLHFSDKTPDLKKVQKVIDDHVPNLHHGLTEDQVTLETLKAKLKEGKDLSLADVNTFLRLAFKLAQ